MHIERRDVFAPASFITGAGLVLSLLGAFRLDEPIGLWLILIGRAMDLIDGPVSRATRPTRFGAAFDATADKIALAAILTACAYYNLAPYPIILYIAAHNIINATASTIAQARGHEPVAAISGKLAMFGENIAVLLYVVSSIKSFNIELEGPALTALILSLPFGILATTAYIKAATRRQNKYTTDE